MTVAAWIVTMFLVVSITLIVFGAAIRPHIDTLRRDRDLWRDRALEAEGSHGRDDGLGDVRLIDPDPALGLMDVFLRGER
jgi:hypothetical protein